jgi:hypothetical protein
LGFVDARNATAASNPSSRLRGRKAALAVVAAAAGRNYRKSCAKEVLTH